MSDSTQPSNQSTLSHADDDDPLQANQVILEAFQVVHCDTQSIQEEARSLEALTASFEGHVSQYTDALAKVLDDTMQSHQTEADNTQETVSQPSSPSVSDTAHSVIDHITALRNHLAGSDDDDEPVDDTGDDDAGDGSPKDKP